MATKFAEYNNPIHNAQPTKHLNINIQYSYKWTILPNAYNNKKEPRSKIQILIKAYFKPVKK